MLLHVCRYCGVGENGNYDFIRVMADFGSQRNCYYTNFSRNYMNFQINNEHNKEYLTMKTFKLHSEYAPTGDQPQAIEQLVQGFREV